jgi:dethiobiotin synthetase
VTEHLLRYHLTQSISIQGLKPIASGVQGFDEEGSEETSGLNEDVFALMQAQPNKTKSDVNFRTFKTPVAPALAGQLENQHIHPKNLLNWVAQREQRADITLIEGVGGLMAPLIASDSCQWLVSDWLQVMPKVDVLLVVPLRLGCINHLLLNCIQLAAMNNMPKWIVLNDIDQRGRDEATERLIKSYLTEMVDVIPKVSYVQQPRDLQSVLQFNV